MRVLFICLARPGFYDAYVHRIASLRAGLAGRGAQVLAIKLRDDKNLRVRK